MGRYASQSDLVPVWVSSSVVAQITQDDPSAVSIDTDVLATHLENAEAEVDTYVGRRYALPLSVVPRVLVTLTCRVARYRLYTARPGDPDAEVKADYDKAIALLERIADGSVSLGPDASGDVITADPAADGAVQVGSSTPTFTRSRLAGF